MFYSFIRTRLVKEDVVARGIHSFTMVRVGERTMKVDHDKGFDLYQVGDSGEILSRICH